MFSNPPSSRFYTRNRYDLMPSVSKNYSDRAAVIIESRDEPLIRWTISNIIHFTQWPVIVYYSKNNEQYLEGLPLKTKIEIAHDFNVAAYNRLLTSIDFWKSLPPHVLIFQTDSFMIRTGIEPFMKYDFVGAPWSGLNMIKYSIPVNIGNGGFSFRNRNKMIQILEEVPYKNELAEDIFFANGFYQLGGKLPPMNIHKKFSVEQIYYNKPLAVHAPWLALGEDEINNILNK